MTHPTSATIIDVQGRLDSRALSIHKVGVKGIRHPLNVLEANGHVQHTIATCNLYANLPAEQKGTHMSRFVEILNLYTENLTPESVTHLLHRMVKHVKTDNGYIELYFPYFRTKHAPISGVPSLLDYDVSVKASSISGKTHIHLHVVIPVTSLCPCSKEISRYGAHNQRSHISIQVYDAQTLWIDELILMAEKLASCELYGVLKRADEKYITEKAYENPKFVEDIVRDIAAALNADPRVKLYEVSAENFESIHNHSAFAEIKKDFL